AGGWPHPRAARHRAAWLGCTRARTAPLAADRSLPRHGSCGPEAPQRSTPRRRHRGLTPQAAPTAVSVPTSDRATGVVRRHEDDERAKWRRGVPEGGIPLRDLDRALLEGVEVVRDALHIGHET